MKANTGFARDLDILEALAEAMARTREGLRLTDLATVTGREKSQLSRALARLETNGLVTRDEHSRRFTLRWRLFHFAAITAEARLIALAQPAMRRIVIHLSETVHLCVLRGTAAVTVHSEVPQHGFRGLSWVGVDAPAHTFTAGRVLLAECSDQDLRAAYPREKLPDLRPTTKIRTRTELLAECARIRRRGYALVDEEFETGLVGASAAVRDFRGIAVASLNIAAPKARLDRKLESAGEYIARVAHALSVELGWPKGHPHDELTGSRQSAPKLTDRQ
jgi:DNA-binding IclR family transcriptional regulator